MKIESVEHPPLRLSAASVKAKAAEVGFDLCGIARAAAYPRLARLRDWIASGAAGDMTYLADSLDERLDPASVLPAVRSVVSLGVVYNTSQMEDVVPVPAGRALVARYARGADYHDVLRARLRLLVQWMADEAGPGLEAFSCVDSGPVQERVFAEQAGLGWIGKNTCLINEDLGSWIFLAEVLTNADLEADASGVDHCGTCTRCLDACPTGAIVEPYAVDATRCLSYLTIETRGPVDPGLRAAIGPRIFGCDICQDVCPWNRRAATSDDPAWQPRDAMHAPALVDLCVMSDEAWREVLKGSAMRRAGLTRIRRSLAYAAAHLDDGERIRAIEALSQHRSSQHADVRDAIATAVSAPLGPSAADGDPRQAGESRLPTRRQARSRRSDPVQPA